MIGYLFSIFSKISWYLRSLAGICRTSSRLP